MQAALAQRLRRALSERDRSHGTRIQYPRAGTPHQSTLNGRPLVNFSCNDYLGLANDPRLIDAAGKAIKQYGVGAGASAVVSGFTIAHEELEHALARFIGCESALVFSSGYMANLAIVSLLTMRGQTVFQDRLNHASLVDGAVLARAKLRRYPHVDTQTLAGMLDDIRCANALIVTDGVFSMDGDVSPLRALANLRRQTGAALLVDDAHGLAVIGAAGRGSLEHCDVDNSEVDALVGTFGKAFGVAGAFVAGERLLIDALRQFARTHIYTTAMPPAQAATVAASLRIISSEDCLRLKLRSNIEYFQQRATTAGLKITATPTPIKPLLISDDSEVVRIATTLLERGYWVGAIRPPTVPVGTARLRIALSAAHSHEQIDGLIAELRTLLC